MVHDRGGGVRCHPCLKKLCPYLCGAEFVILTDHKPLKSLFLGEVRNTKIQRWATLIAEYGAPIEYRKGTHNIRADMLSRIKEPAWINALDTADWVACEQDPRDSVIWEQDGLNKEEVRGAQQKMPQWQEADVDSSEFERHEGLLWSTRTTESTPYPKLVLPAAWRAQVVNRAHREVGHQGVHKTLHHLRECYYWPKQREGVPIQVTSPRVGRRCYVIRQFINDISLHANKVYLGNLGGMCNLLSKLSNV